MTTESLFRLRIPLQLALVAFGLVLGWIMARRSD